MPIDCFQMLHIGHVLYHWTMLLEQQVQSKFFCFLYPYHYVFLRSGHGGQDIDKVSWEITSLIGPFIDTMCPTRVENLFTGVLVQQDQVSLQKA